MLVSLELGGLEFCIHSGTDSGKSQRGRRHNEDLIVGVNACLCNDDFCPGPKVSAWFKTA